MLGLLDNLLNVASNVPLLLLVARYGDDEGNQLGAVAVALMFHNIASGVGTAAGVESLTILRESEVERDPRREGQTLFLSLWLATVVAAVGSVALLVTGIGAAAALMIMAVTPLIVFQRQLRLVSHILNEHHRAARSSAIWLVVSILAYVVVARLAAVSPLWIVICWVTGAFAALAYLIATWTLAREVRPRKWDATSRRTCASLSFEFAVDRGSLDFIGILIAVTYGSVVAGELRLAATLFGVLNLIEGSMVPTLLAETRRRNERGGEQAARAFAWSVGLGLSGVALVSSLLLLAPGDDLYERLLGPSAAGAYVLIPAIGARRVFRSFASGPSMYLRVRGDLRTPRRLRILTGVLMLVTGAVFAQFGGPLTALYGVALGTAVAACAWLAVLRRQRQQPGSRSAELQNHG